MNVNPSTNRYPELNNILDKNETILWSDRPKAAPYILTSMGIGFFTLLFSAVWILTTYNAKTDDGSTISKYFWIFGLIAGLQGLYQTLKAIFSFGNTIYALSDKRIIIRTGFFGIEYKTIDYDKVIDIEVKINMIEKMYNVGSVRFFSGRTENNDGTINKIYDSWVSISNPYDAFKLVKQTSVDIKTDFNYPNALRPETNPGYNTTYKKEL